LNKDSKTQTSVIKLPGFLSVCFAKYILDSFINSTKSYSLVIIERTNLNKKLWRIQSIIQNSQAAKQDPFPLWA
jgi:hypothetical protein